MQLEETMTRLQEMETKLNISRQQLLKQNDFYDKEIKQLDKLRNCSKVQKKIVKVVSY